MTDLLINLLSWLLICGGSLIMLIGGIGILRLPDIFCRLHASGMTDTLGALLLIAGLAVQTGWELNLLKLLFIIIFLLYTTPASGHALAMAARQRQLQKTSSNNPQQDP